MQEGYLDNRLIGRTFTVSEQNLIGYAEFYGIYYHLHSDQPLVLDTKVKITAVDEQGITVVAQSNTEGEH